MQNYKERIKKLHQAEDPNEYILNLTQTTFPNKVKYEKVIYDYKHWYGQDPKILSSIMNLYKLYYELAKDNFISEEQVDKETEDFLLFI